MVVTVQGAPNATASHEWVMKSLTDIWTGDRSGDASRLITTGLLGPIPWWCEVVVRRLGSSACDVVGQLANECLAWPVRDANAARDRCQQHATQPTMSLPAELCVGEPPTNLLAGWLAIQVGFELKAPWYSKDDRALHVLDNP